MKNKLVTTEEDRFKCLVDSLKKEIEVRYGNKEIPSIKEQLDDLGVNQ